MANSITITRLTNGKVSITDTGTTGDRSLWPELDVRKDLDTESVSVWRANGEMKERFLVSDVLEVIREDLTVTTISDQNTLYTELETYFFFRLASGGTGTGTGFTATVTNFAALPPAASHSGEFYFVENGTLLSWAKRRGTFLSDGATWKRAGNITFQVLDSESKIVDDVSGFGLTDQLSSLTADRVRTWQDKNGIIAYLADLKPSFNVDLDSAESSVTRVVAGGRTTFEATHNLNTLDIKPEVFRLSNGRTIGWRIERTGVNTVEASRSGNVADGLFRIVI